MNISAPIKNKAMSNYDTYLEELSDTETADPSSDAIEAAADAMGFVLALHNMFRDNGYDLPEEPDVSDLENVFDGMMGELAAACLFLSEDSFSNVPSMLRAISRSFAALQVPGTEVPTVITKGYERLANRIEATRVQKQQMKELANTQSNK